MDRGALVVLGLVIVLIGAVASDVSGIGGVPRWVGMVFVPPLIGASIWRFEHRSFVATLAWTVPLVVTLMAAWTVAPPPSDGLLFVGSYLVLLAMIFSSRLADRWESIWLR